MSAPAETAPAAFQPDETVYSVEGRAGSYIGRHPDGHVVAPIYDPEDEEDGPRLGRAETWREVFRVAPTARVQEDVAKLTAKASELRDQIRALHDERRALEAKRGELTQIVTRNAALQRIVDCLDGRMKFALVMPRYGAPRFGPIAEVLASKDDYGRARDQKLVTLFGESNGDLSWRVNEYSDGSGSYPATILLFETEQECRDELRARFVAAVADWRSGTDDWQRKERATRWASELPAGMVDVPADLADAIFETKLKSIRANEAEAQGRVDKARAEADALIATRAAPRSTP